MCLDSVHQGGGYSIFDRLLMTKSRKEVSVEFQRNIIEKTENEEVLKIIFIKKMQL